MVRPSPKWPSINLWVGLKPSVLKGRSHWRWPVSIQSTLCYFDDKHSFDRSPLLNEKPLALGKGELYLHYTIHTIFLESEPDRHLGENWDTFYFFGPNLWSVPWLECGMWRNLSRLHLTMKLVRKLGQLTCAGYIWDLPRTIMKTQQVLNCDAHVVTC